MKHMIIAHNGSVQNIPGIPNNVKAPVKPSTNDSASLAIKQEPVTPSLRFSPSPPTTSVEQGLTLLSLDEQVQKVADADPEFAAAFQRQKERELEEAKLICSLDNKEVCLMCSG